MRKSTLNWADLCWRLEVIEAASGLSPGALLARAGFPRVSPWRRRQDRAASRAVLEALATACGIPYYEFSVLDDSRFCQAVQARWPRRTIDFGTKGDFLD